MVRVGLPPAPKPCADTVCDGLIAELTLALTYQAVTAVAASVELCWGVVQQILRTTHNTGTVVHLCERRVGLGCASKVNAIEYHTRHTLVDVCIASSIAEHTWTATGCCCVPATA
jgi:hypothetical protein